MVPYVALILRLFQFMAVLFLRFLVLSIDYRFVMKIPLWGLFIHGKGANIPVLRAVVFKIALKCYRLGKMRLSAFGSADRGGFGARVGRRGAQAGSGVGSWIGEDVAQSASGKGMLSLRTLKVFPAGGFLVCSPEIIRLWNVLLLSGLCDRLKWCF